LFALSPEEWTAVRLSVRVAFWAMAASLPVGIAVAMLLARREFWGKSLLNGLVHLPLILPPVVTGYVLLLLFGRRGPLGAWLAETFGVVFAFRWTGAALACAVMGFPLMVRAIRLPSKRSIASSKTLPARSAQTGLGSLEQSPCR
jgi:molybdate transport system permease protein